MWIAVVRHTCVYHSYTVCVYSIHNMVQILLAKYELHMIYEKQYLVIWNSLTYSICHNVYNIILLYTVTMH